MDDVAGVVTAAATVVLAWAAIVAGRRTLALLRTERDRDTRSEEARRRAQAEKVAGWMSGSALLLLNASDLPVYQVSVSLTWPKGTTSVDPVPVLEPAGSVAEATRGFTHGARHIKVQPPAAQQTTRMVSVGPVPVRVTLEFTDAAGVAWQRGPDGRLVEADGPQEPAEGRRWWPWWPRGAGSRRR